MSVARKQSHGIDWNKQLSVDVSFAPGMVGIAFRVKIRA